MTLRPSLIAALATTLLLGACGYGWEDEPRQYPPSSSGARAAPGSVVEGRSGDSYTVQPGDTLYSIGFRHQLDWKDLAAWNGIDGDYVIRPGQKLRLSSSEDPDRIQTRPLTQVPTPIAPPTPTPIPATAGLPAPVAIPAGAPSAPVAPVIAPAATPRPAAPLAPVIAPVVATGSGRWRWPTAGKPVRGYNLAAGSKGVDIGGDLGQPVTASAAGKVVYSGSALKGYGELIIVKHDDTYLSAYGYNRRRLVKEGDEVKAGQTIAELGLGPEQKPVLHFEIREHGKPVDPMKFLAAP